VHRRICLLLSPRWLFVRRLQPPLRVVSPICFLWLCAGASECYLSCPCFVYCPSVSSHPRFVSSQCLVIFCVFSKVPSLLTVDAFFPWRDNFRQIKRKVLKYAQATTTPAHLLMVLSACASLSRDMLLLFWFNRHSHATVRLQWRNPQ
jgi:hypothetical protein